MAINPAVKQNIRLARTIGSTTKKVPSTTRSAADKMVSAATRSPKPLSSGKQKRTITADKATKEGRQRRKSLNEARKTAAEMTSQLSKDLKEGKTVGVGDHNKVKLRRALKKTESAAPKNPPMQKKKDSPEVRKRKQAIARANLQRLAASGPDGARKAALGAKQLGIKL